MDRLRRSFFIGGDGGSRTPRGAFFGEAEIKGERSVCMQTQEPMLICSNVYMSNIPYAELHTPIVECILTGESEHPIRKMRAL
jgi:hypothetical protein